MMIVNKNRSEARNRIDILQQQITTNKLKTADVMTVVGGYFR